MYRAKLIVFAAVLSLALTASAEFRAGIAVRTINPPQLLPISGGTGPGIMAEEQLDDLTTRALIFESGGVRVAIISIDNLGIPKVLGDRMRAQIEGIPTENILIGATHTHSAPDCYAFPDGQGGTQADMDYIDMVVDETAAVVNDALDALQPASVRIASGPAEGKIAYNAYAEALFDPECVVVQVLDAGDEPFATLVNYAIHPEVMLSRPVMGPDLVGPLHNRIAELGGGVSIFMNGAQGGMVTADNRRPEGGSVQTWEECQRIGRLLAEEAMRIIASAPIQRDPDLTVVSSELELPIETPLMLAILENSPLDYGVVDGKGVTTLNLVNLGNAQMLTIPGEALPNIGAYLKRKMHGEHNLLLGLTNDAFGYILVKEDFMAFPRYNYISRTSLGERTGERYVEAALELVERSPRPGVLAAAAAK